MAKGKGSGGNSSGGGKNCRSASTGRFVRKFTADRHPDKTVGERKK